jgi:hypothetical protein
VLEPRPGPRHPELVSDGAWLPFSPTVLAGTPGGLDPEDPAVSALQAFLAARQAPKTTPRVPWRRGAPSAPAPPPSLDGWRELARTEREVLFGRGRPPQLLALAFRQEGRRQRWSYVGASSARPLRAVREGIRASSWRLDPSRETGPQDTVLHVLVTEQTFASGKRADGRLLTPDLYADEDEAVLTMFVTPRPGYQAGSPNPETPVRIALPHPLGRRRLIDGGVLEGSAQDTAPPTPG